MVEAGTVVSKVDAINRWLQRGVAGKRCEVRAKEKRFFGSGGCCLD